MRLNFIRIWGGFWSKRESKRFFPHETGPITDNLYAIKDKDVNIFVYSDGENTLCIDAGYINNDYLKQEFEKINVDPTSITHLFLTHTDMDHAGAVDKDSKVAWFNSAAVFMGRDEVPMIEGSIPRRFIFRSPVEITREYCLLADQEVVRVGKVTVKAIMTPGHTTGHLAYLINDEILCSGDLLILKDGKVEPFYRTWNRDHQAVIRSVKKLANLDELKHVSILCTAHTQCSHNFETAIEPWRG